MSNNEYDAYLELSSKLDGNEPFMKGGYRVIKPRHRTKQIPEWALSDAKVREIVLCSFPKLHTDAKHRAGAARWIRVIFLYFRREMTQGQIAYILGQPNEDGSDIVPLSINNVRMLVRSIKKSAEGLRADCSGKRVGKMGRPKVMTTSEHIVKDDKDQRNPQAD